MTPPSSGPERGARQRDRQSSEMFYECASREKYSVSDGKGRIVMKRILNVVFVGLLGFAAMCGSAWAQATAQISGSVRDQSGAVLPGVEVTATQTGTGIS